VLVAAGIAAGVAAVWWLVRPPVLATLLVGITGFNLVIAGAEARWRLYGYRTPEAAGRLAWPAPVAAGAERLAFDLIVPARDEAAVIAATLRGLLRQQHPGYRIVVSLCDDDEHRLRLAGFRRS
jgi:hypothetical protein